MNTITQKVYEDIKHRAARRVLLDILEANHSVTTTSYLLPAYYFSCVERFDDETYDWSKVDWVIVARKLLGKYE